MTHWCLFCFKIACPEDSAHVKLDRQLRDKFERIEIFQSCKAHFRRRTFHVPNLMQMSSNKELSLLTLGSAHEQFDV